MRKISLFTSAIVAASSLVAGQASAADLPVRPVTAVVDPVVSYASPSTDRWTGFYAGVNGGAGFVTAPGNDRDWALGAQAGYNQQFGMFVLGGELEGGYTNGLQYRIGTGGVLEQTWGGSARVRGGVAFDNILAFGTIGVATARLDSKGTVKSKDAWATGLTFGGGVEVAVTDSISAKLEYSQTRFDGVRSTIGGSSRSDDLVNHAIKAGVNFRL